jgi:hypothetical protein
MKKTFAKAGLIIAAWGPWTGLASADVPQAGPAVAMTPVMVEVYVPTGRDMKSSLDGLLRRLQARYGFHGDSGFAAQALPERWTPAAADAGWVSIQSVLSHSLQLVRGWLPADRLADMRRDPSVRSLAADVPSGPFGPHGPVELKAFLEEHGAAILAVSGVGGVVVGVDCPVKEPHVHIRPHAPCLVITLAAGASEARVRDEVLRRVPALRLAPHRFEPGRTP